MYAQLTTGVKCIKYGMNNIRGEWFKQDEAKNGVKVIDPT